MTIQAIISSTSFKKRGMMSGMDTTGDRIRHIRKALGLTQAEFADRISLSRGAVGNWEQDKGITQKNLQQIANVFGCSLDWLLSGKGDPFDDDRFQPANQNAKPGKKLDRTLFQVAHDMARNFEQTQLGGLASFEDFNYLVEKYYNELLTRKTQFEKGSEEEH
ncbi:helix-turn-helix domain-containing protein [uncultured Roseibium sp.]|uniref:helix-turn-helix domain-containing protein n=1 Tax=uncultured Roseibium sp. TaxID=1936171 RepID=UPI002606B8C5|nr:helix-turn-helix domain-containing protein [uncultured Roseibium sp.]